jgi:hypothetical protein
MKLAKVHDRLMNAERALAPLAGHPQAQPAIRLNRVGVEQARLGLGIEEVGRLAPPLWRQRLDLDRLPIDRDRLQRLDLRDGAVNV